MDALLSSLQIAGLSFDQWMNVFGVSGVALYLFAHWWRLQMRPEDERMETNRALRMIGLALILTPLFLRWYLSESLIIALSLWGALFSALMLYRARDGRWK